MPLTPEQQAARDNFDRLRFNSGALPVKINRVPSLPDDVKKRFPSFAKWEQDVEAWRVAANQALGGGNAGA